MTKIYTNVLIVYSLNDLILLITGCNNVAEGHIIPCSQQYFSFLFGIVTPDCRLIQAQVREKCINCQYNLQYFVHVKFYIYTTNNAFKFASVDSLFVMR